MSSGRRRAFTPQASRWLSTALWIAQSVLGVLFGITGLIKTTQSLELLHKAIRWTLVVPEPAIRFIGAAELAGALGLLIPAFTRMRPGLTPWAASGLAVIMILAAAFHISRGETSGLWIHAVLGGLAAFVAWGRFKAAPIRPR